MFAPNEEISSNERGEEKKKPGEKCVASSEVRKRALSTNYYAFQQFFNIIPKFLLIEGLIFMGDDLEDEQNLFRLSFQR